jgi:hypothetical protein
VRTHGTLLAISQVVSCSPPCRDSFFASSPLPRMTWYQKIGRKRAMALATGRKPASKSINMSSRFEYGDLCFLMIIT